MDVTTISTQELRKDMPKIRRGLARGKSYILIHRSKPIADIKPLYQKGDTAKFIEAILNFPEDKKIQSKLSAVELVRRERR